MVRSEDEGQRRRRERLTFKDDWLLWTMSEFCESVARGPESNRLPKPDVPGIPRPTLWQNYTGHLRSWFYNLFCRVSL